MTRPADTRSGRGSGGTGETVPYLHPSRTPPDGEGPGPARPGLWSPDRQPNDAPGFGPRGDQHTGTRRDAESTDLVRTVAPPQVAGRPVQCGDGDIARHGDDRTDFDGVSDQHGGNVGRPVGRAVASDPGDPGDGAVVVTDESVQETPSESI